MKCEQCGGSDPQYYSWQTVKELIDMAVSGSQGKAEQLNKEKINATNRINKR